MKAWAAIAAVCIGLTTLLSPGPARAEEMTELWRTPFGRPWAVIADPFDGSCRMSTGSGVTHVNADGTVRRQILGVNLWHLAVSMSDGSWWGTDYTRGTVSRFSRDDELLWSVPVAGPLIIAANPTDGSCFVATTETLLVHLDADGNQLSSSPGFDQCSSIAVDPSNGSYWVARGQAVTHFSASGEALWTGDYGGAMNIGLAVNPSDGSCWVAGSGDPSSLYSAADYARTPLLLHLAADGSELQTITPPGVPRSVSVDPTDGSCWVGICGLCTTADYTSEVLHLSADGAPISANEAFAEPRDLAVSVSDGSCWVGDGEAARLVHLAPDGTGSWSAQGYRSPWSLSVYPNDGTCWVVDLRSQWTVHLSPTGTELWASRGNDLLAADWVSVDASSGACWTTDAMTGRVARIAADGSDFWSDQLFPSQEAGCANPAWPISASAFDGSCWVSHYGGDEVLHIAADGSQLPGSHVAADPKSVAANASDGSCWVGDSQELVHLSATGEEIWSGPYGDIISLSVNPRDGSVWACDSTNGYAGGPVYHFAASGALLWAGDPGEGPQAVAVNPTDGSCWVALRDHVVHLSPNGEGLSSFYACCPRAISVDPSDGSCWVAECRSGQIVRLTVAQAAHDLYVTPNPPDPSAVASHGTTTLSAVAVDNEGHAIASWTWSDEGAGGSFSPSATAASPVYTAPQNLTGDDISVPLTVTVTCDGDPSLTATASVVLTVHTEYLLSLTRSGSGFARVNGVTYPLPWTGALASGEGLTLEAVPSPGWELDHWSGDASGTGTLTLTMDRNRSIGAEFVLVEGTAFSFPVDYPQEEFPNWTGWASAPGTAWEYGPPVAGGGQPIGDGGAILGADPATSHSGGNIIGYVIGGNYQAAMSPQYLTTLPLDFRGRQGVSLHFWRWLAVEDQHFDTAAVEVNTGSGWQRLYTNPAGSPPIYSFDRQWTEVEYPLPQAEGKTGVQVRWQMGGSDTFATPTEYGGWSLDDISFQCAADRYVLGEFSVPVYQLWGESGTMGAAGANSGESTWDDSFGLHARTEHTPTGAWGVDYVPFSQTDPIAPTDSWSCEAQLTAPPVTTLAYTAPVDPKAAGGDATLPCEWGIWQENTGFVPGNWLAALVTISRFSDIQPGSDGNWARFYVEELAGAVPEIVRGYGAGEYRPQQAVTRDQLAVYIARATGLDTSGGSGTVFQDVPAGSWAVGAIEACANAGIIAGYPGGSFAPTEPVTRAGMCKFIANGRAYVDPSFHIPTGVAEAAFPDVPADHWAASWVTACKQADIVQGYPGGSFGPDNGVDRGQMAVFVWRAYLRDRESVVVLGGPTLSRYAPTADRYAVGSVTSATVGDTLHASVLLDAVRLTGSAQTVRFDLSRIVSEGMLAPIGSFTVTLDGPQASAAHILARKTGNPYLPITKPIPTDTWEPGEYLMETSINGVEVARQVHLQLTAATP